MEEKIKEDMDRMEESLEEYRANIKRAYKIAVALVAALFVVYVLVVFVPLIAFILTGHSIAAMVWGVICLITSICFRTPHMNIDHILKREKS